MSNPTIKKVKLIEGGESLEISLHEEDVIKSNNLMACENAPHPDLVKAVQALTGHLAILTGYLPQKSYSAKPEELSDSTLELLKKFTVTGYSISGKEDNKGFVITGHFKNYRDKSVILNTPFELLECAPDKRYLHIDDFREKVAVIEFEVLKYKDEGKKADDQQGSLFPEEKVTKAKIAEPVTTRLGDGTTASIPPADGDAMKRVAEMDKEDGGAGKVKKEKKPWSKTAKEKIQ